MPDTKISALSDAGALTGTEIVPLANAGANERTTTQAIADLGGGGAMSLVSTQTANNTADNLSFTGLTGGVVCYKLIANLLKTASDTAINLRFGTGGTPTYETTNYDWEASIVNDNNGTSDNGIDSQAVLQVMHSIESTGAPGGSCELTIVTDNSTFARVFGTTSYKASDGLFYRGGVGGGWTVSAPITAIQLITAAGNIVSGSASLYRVAQ